MMPLHFGKLPPNNKQEIPKSRSYCLRICKRKKIPHDGLRNIKYTFAESELI